MAIFGRSKKSKGTTSQHRRDPKYSSQAKLHDRYTHDAQTSHYSYQQNPNTSNGSSNASSVQWPNQHQPIHITQNFLIAPPLPERPNKSCNAISRLNLGSVSDLLVGNASEYIPSGRQCNVPVPSGTQLLNQSAALCDVISSKFDAIIELIDGERFSRDKRDPLAMEPRHLPGREQGLDTSRALVGYGQSNSTTNHHHTSPNIRTTLATKVDFYKNSRLPNNLRPMKL
jgi:hypothetical protein